MRDVGHQVAPRTVLRIELASHRVERPSGIAHRTSARTWAPRSAPDSRAGRCGRQPIRCPPRDRPGAQDHRDRRRCRRAREQKHRPPIQLAQAGVRAPRSPPARGAPTTARADQPGRADEPRPAALRVEPASPRWPGLAGRPPGRGRRAALKLPSRQAVMSRRTCTDAVDSQHVPGPVRIALQLAAHILDVRVDRALE